MDLRKVEEVMELPTEGRVVEKKEDMMENREGKEQQVDSGYALKSFLDHIPITSIPNISSTVLEIKHDHCVLDVISLMYNNNVGGAIIIDWCDFKKSVDRDIGFIEFSAVVLWCLEELDKVRAESKISDHGFLSVLEHTSSIAQTKIGELAKLFLWEPFFPIHIHDTLFHALLLFAKHNRLNVIPVVESSNSVVVGFVTQDAVLQLLLQSSGLAWFDEIAEKSLLEFGFKHAGGVISAYSDQSLAETLHILRENQINEVAVVDRKSGTLVGCVRSRDLYLLFEDDIIFSSRKALTAEEFINLRTQKVNQRIKTSAETDVCRNALCLRNDLLAGITTPATSRKSDSLKQAMETLVASKSDCIFMVNESGRVEGVVTIRDVISVFSPPCMDSRINGGGFFNSALEQAGCRVENGMMIQTS
ncbi:SNF1-related protein kinase regulatory subunit gamma-1-like [Typha angustifolia]|uniref:SNF1-related protein kinase regulatory subunit gamma-1-like n=1 Tax=Typha angustifolia TaxID=59011 RepID=UPI003C2E81D4